MYLGGKLTIGKEALSDIASGHRRVINAILAESFGAEGILGKTEEIFALNLPLGEKKKKRTSLWPQFSSAGAARTSHSPT